jgi:two-component system, OmpR family, alkaline phosphatase synthesis response regulator PhoP
MPRKKVLIVDDDVKIVKILQLYLQKEGCEVLTALNGKDALSLATDKRPDVIILDLLLPEIDGLEVCRILRAESDVPIIMLTAKTAERDRIIGLDLGADDYVTKPFSPKELAARVRAVLRRMPGLGRLPDEIRSGDIKIDFIRQEVSLAGSKVNLTPTEFRLLGVMARKSGKVFSRAELIDQVFDYDFDSFEHTVETHISNLRRKIEREPGNPKYIVTVFGAGYKFVEDNGNVS